jgi:phosphoribosylformylglycinamidine synthase
VEKMRVKLIGIDANQLLEISEKRQLSLNLEEMKAIQSYFSSLGRDPTDVELETFAQTWSEHCVHKTFKGEILTKEGKINNLLKSTIARVTKELNCEWCFSVFEDNAGIVDFEGDIGVAFKVETHNHPSAIEPFGGAATGVGGVIRDILGVWGEPIANTDVLCFGPQDFPYHKLPKGTKHPRFISKYVILGIGAYGNNMGIPTVNGAILFDESYVTNPLVFCGTVGLVPKSKYVRKGKPGDILVLVGGKTGRDGIHGVTFASTELHEEAEETFGTAVQIGDPIEEEKIKRGIIEVRNRQLGSAITDLGGGGLSSAVGELARLFNCGAIVELDKVPLKYPKMSPWEIWVSESQERMLLCVPKENLEEVLEIFSDENVEATPIGEFIRENKLNIYYKGELVGQIDVSFLFNEIKAVRKAVWKERRHPEAKFSMPDDLTLDLLKILSSPNVVSKESVIRTYDHEVKAMTVLKPLQGVYNDAPSDAAVLKPLYNSWKGIVISNGINPEYGKIDPYWMAASAIDEAIRNNVAVGGRRIALLDNFCWGNPEKPENMGGLVRAAQACYDIAKAFETPFISGKDSLYNESSAGPVTPTLLISAIGILPDVRKAVSMDLKEKNSLVYIIGLTFDELGGSHYYKVHGYLGNSVPKVDALRAKIQIDTLIRAMDKGLILSCHDLSEGGLAVAAAEMAIGGNIGLEIDLERVLVRGKLRSDHILFSESNSRFLVEVAEKNKDAFEELFNGCPYSEIGVTTESDELIVYASSRKLISSTIDDLRKAWQGGL